MAIKMAGTENGRYGHRDDTTLVSFWVKKDILAKWDNFCENKGLRRTDLIKNAVTDFMLKRDTEDNAAIALAAAQKQQEQITRKIDQIYDQLADLKRPDTRTSDPSLQGRILAFLEEKAFTDAKLSQLMKVDRSLLQDVLAVMKQDRLVKLRYTKDHEGEWYVEPKKGDDK